MIAGHQYYINVTRDLTEITFKTLKIGIMKTNESTKIVIVLIDTATENVDCT